MAGLTPHERLAVGTVTVRRKPAFTYQSPAQDAAGERHLLLASERVTPPPLPPSPPARPSRTPELSQRRMDTHKSSRQQMITPFLPLYHPFGTLALSLPDLDPTVFGLPAPVAVFDDPTGRSSHRQRRPTAKVRDGDEAAAGHPALFVATAPALECEVREKTSPRRRRGGGPGGKRRRREPEDGDATYPAKRARHPRSSGAAPGLSGTRGLSREEGSPALSNAHSGVSPAPETARSDAGEEKKRERRTTRPRRAVARRDSTGSDDTVTSASPSVSATNTAVPRVRSSGEGDEPAGNDGGARGGETKKADGDDVGRGGRQED